MQMLMKCVRDWSQLRCVCVDVDEMYQRLVPAEVCVCVVWMLMKCVRDWSQLRCVCVDADEMC